MSTVWILQHVACETPGIIAGVLKSQGLSAQTIRPFRSQPVPKRMGDTVGLIVMGGPMGVYDQRSYPFLLDEMRLIEDALKQGKPILGVCLGSQLLAAAVGAKVTKGERKEIGWYPVTLTGSARTDRLWKGVEPSFVAYHWHGDIFELPRGALSLASSDLTECQGGSGETVRQGFGCAISIASASAIGAHRRIRPSFWITSFAGWSITC